MKLQFLPPPLLLNNQPFSETHGSVEAKLIARALGAYPLFRDDNASGYYLLEEATHTTSYVMSIKPFQQTKNGHAAFLALVAQYVGEDKWRAMIKTAEELLHNRKWKGQTSYSLENFVSQHRNAYVTLPQCQTHVQYQLPNENTRVTYLLDNIECHDPPLQAAMALIPNDNDPNGKMNDFEAMASFILPHDPVAKKRVAAGTKRPTAEISEVSIEGPPTAKQRTGTTGVEFRFFGKEEYHTLSDNQKAELKDHRDSQEAEGRGRLLSKRKGKPVQRRDGTTKSLKAMVTEAVAAAKRGEKNTVDADQQFKDYIVSVVQSTAKQKLPPAPAQASSVTFAGPPAVTLNGILGHLQNK
jgi:hypothetical protein